MIAAKSQAVATLLCAPWFLKDNYGPLVAHDLLTMNAGRTDAKKPTASKRAGDTALIPVYGVLSDRDNIMTEIFGGTSYESLGRAFDAAMTDPGVRTIVLDIDSPGGTVFGLDEVASKIAAGAKEKKVIAVSNSMAASAAYYLGSQATEFVVSPSSETGCIGCIVIHPDYSEAYKAMGIKLTVIASDVKKAAGNPYEPLDATGRAEYEAEIADYHDQFVRAVARGRSTTQGNVRETFGKGGVFRAAEAVRVGMADRVATLESVLEKYGSTTATAKVFSADFLRRRLMLEA